MEPNKPNDTPRLNPSTFTPTSPQNQENGTLPSNFAQPYLKPSTPTNANLQRLTVNTLECEGYTQIFQRAQLDRDPSAFFPFQTRETPLFSQAQQSQSTLYSTNHQGWSNKRHFTEVPGDPNMNQVFKRSNSTSYSNFNLPLITEDDALPAPNSQHFQETPADENPATNQNVFRRNSDAYTKYNAPAPTEDSPVPTNPNFTLETPSDENPTTDQNFFADPEPNMDGYSLFPPLAIGAGAEALAEATSAPLDHLREKALEKHLARKKADTSDDVYLQQQLNEIKEEHSTRVSNINEIRQRNLEFANSTDIVIVKINNLLRATTPDHVKLGEEIIVALDSKGFRKFASNEENVKLAESAALNGTLLFDESLSLKQIQSLAYLADFTLITIDPNDWDSFIHMVRTRYVANQIHAQIGTFMHGPAITHEPSIINARLANSAEPILDEHINRLKENNLNLNDVMTALITLRRYKETQKQEDLEELKRVIINRGVLKEAISKELLKKSETSREKKLEDGVFLENANSFFMYLNLKERKLNRIR